MYLQGMRLIPMRYQVAHIVENEREHPEGPPLKYVSQFVRQQPVVEVDPPPDENNIPPSLGLGPGWDEPGHCEDADLEN